jgi:hypothetical protein
MLTNSTVEIDIRHQRLAPDELLDEVFKLRAFSSHEPPHALRAAEEALKTARQKLKADPSSQARQKNIKQAERHLARISKRQLTFDPKGIGEPIGPGYSTFARLQLVDADGQVVADGRGMSSGSGKTAIHAEEHAIRDIKIQLKERSITRVPSGHLDVAVDQVVCKKCAKFLTEFAEDLDLASVDAHYHSREGKTARRRASAPVVSERGVERAVPSSKAVDGKDGRLRDLEKAPYPAKTVTPKTAARTATLGVPEGEPPIPTVRTTKLIYRRHETGVQQPLQPAEPTFAEERSILRSRVVEPESRGLQNRFGTRPPLSAPSDVLRPKLLHRLKSAARQFARGVGLLFKPAVLMPLSALLQFAEAVKAHSITMATLAGEGSVLRSEVQFARQFKATAERILFDYEKTYHQSLTSASTNAYLLIFMGSEEARLEMSVLASDQITNLESHLHDVNNRLKIATLIEENARVKWVLADKLQSNLEFAFLAGMATATTGTQMNIIAAKNDWGKVRGDMLEAVVALTRLRDFLQEDVAILEAYL